MRLVYRSSVLILLGACSAPEPNSVLIELAPEVVSSIDGTTTVRTMVVGDRTPLDGEEVQVTVSYTDRNGTDHAIDPVTGTTDARGAFEATLAGLDWEGTGTVTATVTGTDVTGVATFSVLDRTPPTVEILSPTVDNHIGPGLPLEVEVHVADEIGVSSVVLEADGELTSTRSTVVASGATDTNVRFRLNVPNDALPGPTITLYALAGDLSGNQSAAVPLVLTVDPAIAIATPPGLDGTLLSDGSDQFLGDARAIAVSPMDGMIYVADNAGGTACQGGCIRKVDPATGQPVGAALVLANGTMEGVAFDATGDNLYYTDRQDRVGRLTWNAGTSTYQGAVTCNDAAAQFPAQPYHLVQDPTLGTLIADDETQDVLRLAACTGNNPTNLSNGNLDQPRGLALGPGGEIYVSDINNDTIYTVDRTTGDVTRFEDRDLDQPYGLEWLAGGTSEYDDSLLVALEGDRIVGSTTGNGARPVAYLRNNPIDVAVDGLTAYILTRPSAGDFGRIFRVTGF